MKSKMDKVGKEVKISIKIKLNPTLSQKIKMDNMFSEYKRAFNYVINHINKIYISYNILAEPIEDDCSECNQKRFLGFEKDNKLICGVCFGRKWSFITIRNELMGYGDYSKKVIQKEFPYLTHLGIYQGTINDATSNYKAYIKKINQRKRMQKSIEEEIKKTNKNLLNLKSDYFYYNKEPKKMICNCCNLKKAIYMLSKEKNEGLCEKCFNEYKTLKKKFRKLRKLKSKIKLPEMKKNSISFYSEGLAYFTKNYDVEISQPETKEKMLVETKIGDYQKESINLVFKEGYETKNGKKICKQGYHKKTTPRIIKQKEKYYFIYPYRKECNVFNTNEAIKEEYKKNKPNISILSFGLKKPINCLIDNGEKLKFKVFGNGILTHRKERNEVNQNRIIQFIQDNYVKRNKIEKLEIKDKKEIKRRINKFRKKTNHNLMNYSYRLNHYLSHQLVNWLVSNKVEFVIFRDLTKIKDFSYGGLLGKRLHKWAVMQLQNMIEYKANLNDISIFKLKYSDTNKLICSKCNEINDKKVLTDKLNYIKRFKCNKCNYDNDYHFNDCNNLLLSFNEWKPLVSKTKQMGT